MFAKETLRSVYLGDRKIFLLGKKPSKGWKLTEYFQANPARKTRSKLTSDCLKKGLVIVSTLPNIRSFACSQQILDLENEVKAQIPSARIYHIASDPKSGWKEVEELHPFLDSPGFTLHGVPAEFVDSFKRAFGVGVKGTPRIAHGLFALLDGEFLVSYIPRQQYGVPNIRKFIRKIIESLPENFSKS